MRPQLGCYGHEFMKTPHIDNLSATGLHFDFAYSNFAYCAPSRNSFMSGRRPDRTRALNFRSTFRECRNSFALGCGPGADWVTMPQFFVSLPPYLCTT
jgi:arylsulfatase A-like enzyme